MTKEKNRTVIKTKELSVSYGNIMALDSISVEIREGEFVVVIGPNGSGKSTFMRAILGLMPFEGSVSVLGKTIDKVLENVGYVPQRFDFDRTFPMTVQEFLNLSLHSKESKYMDTVLDDVEMTQHKDKLLGELSGGQLQRVLIARALINEPKILFLDEPTASIDIEGEKDFFELLEHQQKKHGVTIVMISHEMDIVYKHATQSICLNKKLLCSGPPRKTITQDVLEQLYTHAVGVHPHERCERHTHKDRAI